jgi:hypothetical protein
MVCSNREPSPLKRQLRETLDEYGSFSFPVAYYSPLQFSTAPKGSF